jgi:hypothetical protein
MKYEVRYQRGGDEHTVLIDADDAASAAEQAQALEADSHEVFELIQVHYLEDEGDKSSLETTPQHPS